MFGIKKLTAAAALAALFALPVQASLITIEPDDYLAGMNISNPFEGIHLSMATLDLIGKNEDGFPIWAPAPLAPVYSHAVPNDPNFAPTGDQIFGWQSGPATNTDGTRWGDMMGGAGCLVLVSCTVFSPMQVTTFNHALRIDIDNGADFVSIIGRFSGGDPPGILAYDEDGHLLTQCFTVSPDGPCVERYHLDGVFENPAYGWGTLSVNDSQARIRTVLIGGFLLAQPVDHLVVSVPEPGTLALFGLALAGVGLSRRSRRARKNEKA